MSSEVLRMNRLKSAEENFIDSFRSDLETGELNFDMQANLLSLK